MTLVDNALLTAMRLRYEEGLADESLDQIERSLRGLSLWFLFLKVMEAGKPLIDPELDRCVAKMQHSEHWSDISLMTATHPNREAFLNSLEVDPGVYVS